MPPQMDSNVIANHKKSEIGVVHRSSLNGEVVSAARLSNWSADSQQLLDCVHTLYGVAYLVASCAHMPSCASTYKFVYSPYFVRVCVF